MIRCRCTPVTLAAVSRERRGRPDSAVLVPQLPKAVDEWTLTLDGLGGAAGRRSALAWDQHADYGVAIVGTRFT
jgi:hypothetical protein